MDRLTIFPTGSTVTLETTENNTIDNVVKKLADVERELKLTRKGNEAFIYGEEVEDSDEVDLEEIEE